MRQPIADGRAAIQEWIASRPPSVRALAAEFPLGSVIDETDYVIGWTENDMILVSPIWLGYDYEAAMSGKRRVCAAHVRDGSVVIRRPA